MSINKYFRNWKMQYKLLASYLIVVMIPILFVGILFTVNTRNVFLKHVEEINQITLNQIKTNIKNSFDDSARISDNILAESDLIDTLSRQYSSESAYLKAYVDNIQVTIKKLHLIMPKDIRISFYSNNETLIQDNYAIFYADDIIRGQSWYQAAIDARGANTVSMPYFNHKGELVFSISRVLYSGVNSKRTVVSRVEVPVQSINTLIEVEAKNKDIYIVNSNGYVFTNASHQKESQVRHTGKPFSEKTMVSSQKTITGINTLSEMQLSKKGMLGGWRLIFVSSTGQILDDINKNILYGLMVCFAAIAVSVAFIFLFSNKLTVRLRTLTDSMRWIQKEGSFDVFISYEEKDEVGELSRSFKEMIDTISTLINEVYVTKLKFKDLELEKKEAELRALQSQINPHFLFNTMESISMNLLVKGETEICEAVRSFSKILRKSIQWGSDKTTFKQEIDLMMDYLKVQKFRYKDKFEFEISIDERLYDLLVPKFTMQPIIENSIYHGLEMKEGKGLLQVTAREKDTKMEIVVKDNGNGIKKEQLDQIKAVLAMGEEETSVPGKRKSIGLKNVDQRIKMYYGNEYGLQIESRENTGTTVIIEMPVAHNGGEQ